MSTSLRILAMTTLLTANVTTFTSSARTASLDEPLPLATTAASASQPVYWKGRGRGWGSRRYDWHAPSELIAGVRGGSPLTVPFYGSGWYPGPACYYGPRRRPCGRGGNAVISVKY
jgi:hypothetical protein